jgi:hypothetical protein
MANCAAVSQCGCVGRTRSNATRTTRAAAQSGREGGGKVTDFSRLRSALEEKFKSGTGVIACEEFFYEVFHALNFTTDYGFEKMSQMGSSQSQRNQNFLRMRRASLE